MARMGTGITLIVGAAAGAAAQYFLDAEAGRRRRHTARDQGLALARREARDAFRKVDYAAGQAKGAAAGMKPGPSDDRKLDQLGDAALARKVETEIFREADRDWIGRLERDAEQVTGVKAVRNLLHPPGTPAPSVPAAH